LRERWIILLSIAKDRVAASSINPKCVELSYSTNKSEKNRNEHFGGKMKAFGRTELCR
jgi:hypothetical protein